MNWDSADGIATGYRLDSQGVRVQDPVGARFFSSICHPDWFWGPPSLLSNGYWGCFPGIKKPGSEDDHSSPTSAEAKKTWIYTSTPPYVFMEQCLISQTQGKFYLTICSGMSSITGSCRK
jgi:hypothetical protein